MMCNAENLEFTPCRGVMRRSAMLMALIFVLVPFSAMATTVDGSLSGVG